MNVRQHRLEADAAKASMLSEIQQLKARLSPATLANDAVENAREKAAAVADQATDFVRRKPAVAGSVAGAIALFLVRKPLCRLFRRPSKHHDRPVGPSEGNLS